MSVSSPKVDSLRPRPGPPRPAPPLPARHNGLLVLAVIALAVLPLLVVRGGDFAGADGKAEAAITSLQPHYKPWFQPFVEPASGEVESLLFATQAAVGAGVIGFVIGLYRGRRTGLGRLKRLDGQAGPGLDERPE